jgi:lambda family phage portal protein
MAWYDIFIGKTKTRASWFQPAGTAANIFSGANTGRLMNDFVAYSKSADSEIKNNIRLLRDRSRDLAKNNAYARRYIKAYTDNVIGPNGVQLQARSRDPNGAIDTFANNVIENAFKDWGSECSADGKLTWVDAQRLFAETYARDGEVLIRVIPNFNNKYKFAIEFIEADFLDEELNRPARNGENEIRMGIEIDKFGRPLVYHLLKKHPYDNDFVNASYTREYNSVPANEIIHFFHQERPHQKRGVPPLSSAMRDLKMLDGYMEAELVAARVSASKMGFFKSGDGQGYLGDDVIDTNNVTMNAQPGTFEQLPSGVSFESFDPQHPTSAFRDFSKGVLRAVASSLSLSYNTLANDLEGVNYSSLRQGALEERDHYKCEQSRIIKGFHDKVYRQWLKMNLLTDNLQNLPASKFNKFAIVQWRPRGWQWVDPKKEIDALKVGVDNGFLSMQDVQASYGRDVEDVFQQIQVEKELANEYGIQTQFEPFGAKDKIPLGTGTEEEE